jgi:hypothetical protein
MLCPRCGADLASGYTMSWFTTEDICLDCKDDERGCPNYTLARTAEQSSRNRGETNFAGIGLALDDEAYLAARRQARSTKKEEDRS